MLYFLLKLIIDSESLRYISQKGCIGLAAFLITYSALANPSLNNVSSGTVSVQQTQNSTVVNQSSQKAIINWNSFNIGAQESTHFQQPQGGVALNRISPTQGASQIYGRLTATGQIILINPAGVYFGPSAYVNVGGLIATTANITDQNFLSGNYQFDKVPGYSGAIVNQGQIIAAQNGLIALVAPAVMNNGMIQANVGKVVLASGEAFTMNFSGDNLINFSISQKTSSRGIDKDGNALPDGVRNTGSILADGGQVMITAQAASAVLDHMINMEGITQVKSVSQNSKGEIILSGDPSSGVVRVAGKLNASGKGAGQKGGDVTVTGYNILLDQAANIDVSGDLGGGNIRIGGNYQGKGPLPNANATVMAPGASLVADAITNGNGGEIILWADNVTKAYGNISTRGGALGGNGGFIETSGKAFLDVAGIQVDTRAPFGKTGTWLLDPTNIYIALNQANATAAGMSGTNTSANTLTGGNTFQASGAVNDSLLTTGSLTSALGTTNVTVTTVNASGGGTGFINVVDPITWTSANTLLLNASATTGSGIIINAPISGVNGTLQLQTGALAATITTNSSGTINVANFNLLRGTWTQVSATLPTFNVTNNFQINSGTMPNANARFLRATGGTGASGTPYTITDVYGLQGIGSTTTSLANSYSLANNINMSSVSTWNSNTGFVPIGNNASTGYSGTFNGQNFILSNLFIDRAITGGTGLFGFTNGATIQNLGLTNININTIGLAGGLTGHSTTSTISNVYTTGTITAHNNSSDNPSQLGGLIGLLQGGNVSNSYSTANLSITSIGTIGNIGVMGGLIGDSNGTISTSYATGSLIANFANTIDIGGLIGTSSVGNAVSTSYSSGAITLGNNATMVGGFIGFNGNGADVTNSYSTSAITTGTGAVSVGGFAGRSNGSGSTITNSYSSGRVTTGSGSTNVGGFIGLNENSSSISNNFWDTDASNRASGFGTNTATVSNLRGGCFSGTCTIQPNANSSNNGAAVNLSALATFSGVGWSITSTASTTSTKPAGTWFIFAGNTRPMLLMEQSTNIVNAHQLQLAASTLGASYTLINDINLTSSMNNVSEVWGTNQGAATGAGFFSIGNNTNNYTGTFLGQNFSISNLYINLPAASTPVGLFGALGATGSINNLSVTSATVTGGTDKTGIIVGVANGDASSGSSLTNLRSSGTVTGSGMVGGIVGQLGNASAQVPNLTNSYSSASVTATGSPYSAGGIAGTVTNGIISSSYATGAIVANNGASGGVGGLAGFVIGGSSVNNSYSTGSVTVGNNTTAGGLVGWASPTISNSYSTGSVTGGTGSTLGGLLGHSNGAIVSTSYSTGYVSGGAGSTVGGLIGTSVGTTTDSYWNTETSGQALSAGGTGLTTTQMMAQSNYAGFDFSTVWNIIEGQSYPYLRAFYTTTPRAVSSTSTAAVNTSVNLAVNGSVFDTTNTGANGFFYFLEGNNNISGINNTIADGAGMLMYLNSGSEYSNILAVAPTGGGSLSGLTMAANTITIAGGSNTLFGTAKGALSSTNILYSVSGANLTVGNASHLVTHLVTTSGTSYTMDGTIAPTSGGSGNYTFNDDLNITGTNITSSGAQTYNGTTTLNNNAQLISGSGLITFNGAITAGSTGVLTLQNGAATGNVIFNDNVSLGGLISNAGNFAVSLLGSNNQFTDSAVTLNNTGGVTLGNASNDSFNFSNASTLTTTASTTTLFGTFDSGVADMVFGTTVLAGDTTISEGSPEFGAITGNHHLDITSTLGLGFNNDVSVGSLSVDSAAIITANGITLATNDGDMLFDGVSLTMNGPLTLKSGSGRINFNASLIDNVGETLILQDNTAASTGTVSFTGNTNINLASLTTFGNNANYAVDLSSNSAISFANAVNFDNTGGVTLRSTTGSLVFNGGVTSTASTTTLGETISTSNDAMTFGDVVLAADTSLLSGSADITFNGSVDGTGRTLTLQNGAATGNVIFNNDVTLDTLDTQAGGAFGISFLGGTTTISNHFFANNTGGITFGNDISDVFNYTATNDQLTYTDGTSTVAGTLDSSSGNSNIVLGDVALATDTTFTTGQGGLTLGEVTGNHHLTINSDGGAALINADIGSLTVNGNIFTVNGTSLKTTGNQDINTILNLVGPLNINSGSGTINVSSVNGNGETLSLQDAAATGTVNLNDVTLGSLVTFAGNYAVTLNGATITNLATFNNIGGVTLTGNLNFDGGLTNTGSTTTLNGTLATVNSAINLGTLSLAGDSALQSGSGSISIGLINDASRTLTLQDNTAGSTGNVTFTNNVTLADLTTFGQAYGVIFNGGTNIFSNTIIFNNTNGVTLGNGSDNFTFNNGLTSTASTTTLGGNITTSNDAINLGAVSLAANSTLSSGSAIIDINGTVSGAANILTLQDNTAGSTGSVTFNNDVTLAGLTTFAQAYAVALNGASNTFTNAVTFNNTNGVTLGNDGDSFIFDGGLTSTASTTTLGGTIATSNDAIALGTLALATDATLSSGSGSISLGSINAAARTLTLQDNTAGSTGAVTFNNDVTLAGLTTFGQAYAVNLNGANNTFTNAVNFLNTNGVNLGNGGDSFTFNGGVTSTASTTTLGGNIFTSNDAVSLGTVALSTDATLSSGSGSISLGSINAAARTLTLQDNTAGSTGAVTFNNDVTLAGLTTFGQAYAVNLNGANNTFTNAVNFLNTNGVTLGNGGDTFTFNGGLTSTAGTTNLNAAINTSNDAISLGTTVLAGNSSLNSGAAAITLAGVTGANNLSLTSSVGSNLNGAMTIASLTTAGGGTDTVNANSIATSGNQTYGNNLNIANSAALNSDSNITFNGTVNGNGGLTVASDGVTTFNQAVGGTSLASLTVDGGSAVINSGLVTTIGSQTYNTEVMLGAGTALNGAGVSLNDGIVGNQNLTITAGNTSIEGTLSLNNVAIIGNGGNNSFALNTGSTQTWSFTGNDTGNLTGTAGVLSGFGLINIQNVTGGSAADSFALNGGTVSGNINGGAGNNTLTADNMANTWNVTSANGGTVTGVNSFSNIQNLTGNMGNDEFTLMGGTVSGNINGSGGNNKLTANNTTNTWNLSGTDNGNVTGVSGFSSIQNLTGGSGNDTFVFANNAKITGNIDGGALSATNTLNYLAYNTAVDVTLSATNDGITENQSSNITSFTNINNLLGNSASDNSITMPTSKAGTVVVTGARAGYINDPIFFNGFTLFNSLTTTDTVQFTVPAQVNTTAGTATVNGVVMTFNGFDFGIPPTPPVPPTPEVTTTVPNVSQIIQQPNTNAISGSPNWSLVSNDINQNIDDLVRDVTKIYDIALTNVKINPYCYSANN